MNGNTVALGNGALMEAKGLHLDGLDAKAVELSGQGKTPVFVASDGMVIGAIAVADTLKQEAPEVVSRLHDMGMEVIMLTGDSQRTAEAIAGRLGGRPGYRPGAA